MLLALSGSAFTVAVCWGAGCAVARREPSWGVKFVVGASVISLAVLALAAAHLASAWMFAGLGVAAMSCGWALRGGVAVAASTWPAAALVHLAFVGSLASLMIGLDKRFGWAAGVLLVASPVVAVDAASAYNDAALGCVVFAMFILIGARGRESVAGGCGERRPAGSTRWKENVSEAIDFREESRNNTRLKCFFVPSTSTSSESAESA